VNDKIAASILARLLAKGLLVGIWVPPQEVRELRGLVAQRQKMTHLATQAKNRLHAVIQRHHLKPPAGNPFARTKNGWWQALVLGKLEKMNLQSDLETLQFAEKQEARLEEEMTGIAAENEEIGRLLHIPGFGVITAVTVYAAIGDIGRFVEAKKLVGYAGLGTRVHDSGMTTRTGKITKAGRRDLRVALVEAAHVVANSHPHWKAELARLQPRIGYNRAIVATPAPTAGAVLRESCWLPFGMCWRAEWQTVSQNLKRYRRRCCALPTKLERKIVRGVKRRRNLRASVWMFWAWVRT
jgi:transposase